MLEFLRSRQWVLSRRLFLVGLVLIVAYRQYGDSLTDWLRGADPTRDIVITKAEFRPELPGERPAWIIGFRNDSAKSTYDNIELEATYFDDAGNILETDKLVVKQKLAPGHEQVVPSRDFKTRGAATRGMLKVVGAQELR